MKKLYFTLCFVGSWLGVSAQFNFDFNDSIRVKKGVDTLLYPWAGGFNYVQLSDFDFDFDGDADLFFFDRSHDNIRVLRQVTENGLPVYRQVHNAGNYFPPGLKNRVALVDYDNDGKKDIFTYGIGGIKVYRNTGSFQTGLSWELISEVLDSDYNGSIDNLYVSSSDIPAYADVDFDGDMDVLTFDQSGERMEYHQNQSRELYGHSDSLVFVLKNQCWGKFTEDAITSQIVLNSTETPCGTGNVPNPQLQPNDEVSKEQVLLTEPVRHAGSTVLALDYDNSGVYDLVIGDVNLANLILLTNGGTAPNTNSAMTGTDENFPSNTTPVNVSIFPAAFYVDADLDGVKDLVVCPNAKGISHNEKSIYFYKNTGSGALPVFSFRSKSYFQEDMIETGTGSIPVFTDQNGDGLQDLLVAEFFRYKEQLSKESVLYHFRNTGLADEPFFNFVESDYLGFSTSGLGLRIVPAFGDVDSDGDQDLFLGLDDGTLVYRENTAGPGASFAFAAPVADYTDNLGNVITVQNYCFPQLFDLNEDGLLDLILGKKTGELVYYENIGTAASPSFELKNSQLGGIDVATLTPDGYPAPHFFKYQDTIRLLLGSADGKLRFYDGIKDHLAPDSLFHLISDAYLGISTDYLSSCFVNDIDNDGKLDLFVGGDLGGIFHLEHSENGTLNVKEKMPEENFEFRLYPNPAKQLVRIEINSPEAYSVQLLSALGQPVLEERAENGKQSLDISHVPPGLYFVLFHNKDKVLLGSAKLLISN
ncbi:MAG: FG-GAP-like repeat-containing protein [Bacteroidota bacterium]